MSKLAIRLFFLTSMLGLIFNFQNCSRLETSAQNDEINMSVLNTLVIYPAATTVEPLGTVQFRVSGGNSTNYRFSVIGKGSVDEISGAYMAPSTSNDDILRVTDSSGAASFSFVKVASSGSPMALYPAALLIGFQRSFQFIATGGTPPFTYSLSSLGVGGIDSGSGIFTTANAAGSTTLTVTDANGLTASSLITVQQGVATLAPIYAPNPLAFGQVATFYSSNLAGGNLILQSGPGATQGLSYTPGYQLGPANLQLINGNLQLPIQIPLGFVAGSATCPHGKQVFTYTGADQTLTLPSSCGTATIKMWGGGGAGGGLGGGGKFPGGGGGFVSGVLMGTETENLQTLTIIVGSGGGVTIGAGVYGGGGGSSDGYGLNSGGGRSAIRINGIEILTAGAGGGGFYQAAQFNNRYTPDQGVGGAGGGLVAQPGTCGACKDVAGIGMFYNGGGGTQTTGGSSYSGFGTGTQFQGGGSAWGTPSGGGGYYGGGGGGTGMVAGGSNTGGGGGGSSYIGGSASQSVYDGTTVGGNGLTPGNTSDPDYIAGIGVGGGSATDDQNLNSSGQLATPGGNGLVVIEW